MEWALALNRRIEGFWAEGKYLGEKEKVSKGFWEEEEEKKDVCQGFWGFGKYMGEKVNKWTYATAYDRKEST